MTGLVAWHVPGLLLFGVLRGRSFDHCALLVAPVAAAALVAASGRLSRRARAVAVAFGLLWSSSVLTAFWNGTIEAHFHFFVVVSALATYEEWVPYLLAFLFVAIDHGVVGTIAPGAVYNHASAERQPWLWAGIHALFIGALGVVNVVSWRMNEGARAGSAASEERLRLGFESAPTGMALVDLDGTILRANRALLELTGYEEDDLAGTPLDVLRPVDDRRDGESWPCSGDGGLERRFLRKDGSTGWGLWRHALLPGTESAPGFWISHCLDITERRDAELALTWQARHDPLTGLPNRALFLERLGTALERRKYEPGRVAVLFIDLDNFKVVNDSLGHAAGDRLLDAVAERLRRIVRPDDVLARFGGDEFTILIGDVRDESHALRIADRIHNAFRAPVVVDGVPRFVSASVGVSLDGEEDGADDLLRDADVAMYRAKELGKARAELFDVSMRRRAVERLDLELGLRGAVARGELVLLFQPQVALDGLHVHGAEALLRWDHPALGRLAPDRFIPLAEQTGLIVPIGEWVLHEACRQLVEWGDPELHVAVNVSPFQLGAHEGFVQAVSDTLDRTGIEPSRLCVEITETAMMVEDAGMRSTLAALKRLGIRLAVDDFGVGHASLGHLRSLLPIDTLKIDRSFVDGMVDDRSDAAIVESVIVLARSLELQVVAEGVETPAQEAKLRLLACQSAQGYHFAEPLEPAAFAALLQEARAA
jgi:diguanylate cyclase (GGDEF)-like protein/PAS domain S-box-containing protein